MHRSSTSSSKTLQEFPKPTTAFFGVIALLLVIRIVLAMYPDPLPHLSRDYMELFARQIDSTYRAQKRQPKILILGSSRFTLLDRKSIGHSLQIPHSEIVNLATPASTYFLMRNFLKRYPDALSKCEVVVIDVLPAQMDRYTYLSEESELFLRMASLAEKIKIRRPSMRLLALFDTIFPFYSMRYTALEWHRGLFYSAQELKRYSKKKDSQLGSAIGVIIQRSKEQERIEMLLAQYYTDASPSPIQEEALESMLDLIPDSTRILLIRPPYRDDVQLILWNNEKYRESYTHFRSYLESIDRDNVEMMWIDSASDLELNDEDYNADGAHFSSSGLIKISLYLSELINEKGLSREPDPKPLKTSTDVRNRLNPDR